MSETEQEPLSSPLSAMEESETSPEKTELQELGKSLSLPDEVIGEIQKKSQDTKQEITTDLKKIQEEIQKAGYTKENIPEDVKKKIQDTLGDYGIYINTVGQESKQEGVQHLEAFKQEQTKEGDESKNKLLKAVEENVQSVKDLSPDVVNTELESFKKTSPLPDDVATKIAEKTGSTKQEVLQGGGKNSSQVQNLIDAYYLSSDDLAEKVKSRLPKSEEGKVDSAFHNLRSSLKEVIPLYPVSSKEVQKLIPDKSRATQEKVTTITEGITQGKNVPVVREGNKLSYRDPNNPTLVTHEIELGNPPVLKKSLGNLEIKREMKEKPNNERMKEREAEKEKVLKFGSGMSELSEDTTKLDSWNPSETKNRDGTDISISEDEMEKLDAIKDTEELSKKQENISNLLKSPPINPSLIRQELQSYKAIVEEKQVSGNEYILEGIALGDGIGFPESMQEEIRRRTLIDTPLSYLSAIHTQIEQLEKSPLLTASPSSNPSSDELETSTTQFEQAASANLSFLTEIGFDTLGQQNLDTIIGGMNERSDLQGSGIDATLNTELTGIQKMELLKTLGKITKNDSLDVIELWKKSTGVEWKMDLEAARDGTKSKTQEGKDFSKDGRFENGQIQESAVSGLFSNEKKQDTAPSQKGKGTSPEGNNNSPKQPTSSNPV